MDKWALCGHFYSYVDPVWSLYNIGTDFHVIAQVIFWVELPVQRRLYPIFVKSWVSGKEDSMVWCRVTRYPQIFHGLTGCQRTPGIWESQMSQKLSHPNIFMLWHDRLGHPRSTIMRRIIENSHGHPLKNHKILLSSDYPCTACSQCKLIVRPSHTKVLVESPTFLERIQGDICGPFCYFMMLIDVSFQWSHVCLLSIRNVAFVRLLAQIIRL